MRGDSIINCCALNDDYRHIEDGEVFAETARTLAKEGRLKALYPKGVNPEKAFIEQTYFIIPG